MMQTPPIPPGFTTTPPQANGTPPIPPGFSTQPPPQARAQARPAPRPVAPQVQQAPASSMTDLGISADEEITALVRQGYTMEQARAMAAQPEAANAQPGGYRIVTSEDLAPEDTPNSLSAQGYAYDGSRGVWARTVGTEQIQPPPSVEGPGYLLARQQEEEKRAWRPNTMLPDWMERGYGELDFTSQLTSPFNDEMAGIIGYGMQGAANLGRRLMGEESEVSAMDRARAMADMARQSQQTYQQENPVQSAIGNIVGGFAFAPSRALGVAGAVNGFARPAVGQAYRQAAGVGGVYGAADAEGGLTDRAIGAATGSALGVGTAGLIDGGVNATRSLFGGRRPRLDRAIEDTITRDDRMGVDDLLSRLNGLPEGGLPLDVAGPNLRGLAEVVAQTPGPGQQRVTTALNARQADAGNRIQRRIGEQMGGEGNYFATLDNSISQRRDAAKTVIDQIGDQQYRPSPDAINSLRSEYARAALENQVALRAGSPNPEVRASAERLRGVVNALGRDVEPNIALDVRTAQDLSRAMLDASSDAWRSSNGGLGGLLGDIGKAVRGDARNQVGAYDQWLTRYGDESSQIEALELGRRIFRNADDPSADGVSAEVLRREFSEMSDTAKDMFRKGIAEAIVARSRTSRGGVGAMRDLVKTEEFADRVRLAFPDEQAFTQFMNAAEFEVQMANTNNTVLGNSATSRRDAARQRFGAQGEEQAASTLANVSIPGIPLELGRQAIRATGRAVSRNRSLIDNPQTNDLIGQALTDPEVLRQMLSRPSRRGLFGRAPAGVAGSIPQLVF